MVQKFKQFSEAREHMWKAGHDKEKGHFFVKHSRTQERRGEFKTGREALDHAVALGKETKKKPLKESEEKKGHPYKMTYEKVRPNSDGTHHTHFIHVTHHLDHAPFTREGARGAVSRTEKHQELKKRGYSVHSVGEHDDKKTTHYTRPVKHSHE